MEYDVIVIGGGAGGLSAARSAARRGARTLLVQQGRLGGDCTFTGCVPSKTLIEAAERGQTFDAAMQSVHAAVGEIAANEDEDALQREAVEVRHGWARFTGPGRLDVEGRPVAASRVIIATGAGPLVPPIAGLEDAGYLTSETVWDLDRLPASLVVLGGGAVGCELANAFARFGTEVTIVEGADRILRDEEPETSRVISHALKEVGVTILTSHDARRVQRSGAGGMRLALAGGTTVEAERLLVAVGRQAAVEGMGLDAAGVEVDQGVIVTDASLATTAAGVWAVGDVNGRLPFTHAANEMGRIAAGNALSKYAKVKPRMFRPDRVPWVTFTAPEVGRVGRTEAEAAEHGGRVAYLPMAEVDRAIAAGQTDGFVKLIAGPRRGLGNFAGGKLLGATIVAPRAGELIHEPALAMRTHMFTGRLAQTVHAYPTWSVAVQQAAAQFFQQVGGREARPAEGG